jgi:hypothetical protein
VITTVALEGEAAEPFSGPGGTLYSEFDDVPAINNLGTVVYLGDVEGTVKRESVYMCAVASCPAAPAAIALSSGDVDTEVNVLTRLGSPHVSDAGDISLRADARGPTVRSSGVFVWRFASDTVERIAVKGEPVPGVTNSFFGRIDRPWISAGGRIAFGANTRPGARRAILLFE